MKNIFTIIILVATVSTLAARSLSAAGSQPGEFPEMRCTTEPALGQWVRQWTDGVVPYEISPDFSETDLQAIQYGIAEWNRLTFFTLQEREQGDSASVRFVPTNVGYSSAHLGLLGGHG